MLENQLTRKFNPAPQNIGSNVPQNIGLLKLLRGVVSPISYNSKQEYKKTINASIKFKDQLNQNIYSKL